MQNTPHHSPIEEMALLTGELDRLLARYQSTLRAEGIERQVENLKRLLETCRHDFAADSHISETGAAWLEDLSVHLKQVVEERQRLEGEGGLPPTREQAEQTEDLLRIIRRIEKISDKDSLPH